MAWRAYNTVNGQILGETSATEARPVDYLTDALGSIVATASKGTIQNTYRYAGYGQQVSKTGTGSDPKFLWVGGWGYRVGMFTYVRARHYHAVSGAWSTVDLLWPEELAYSYVFAAVTVFVDPEGFQLVRPPVRPPIRPPVRPPTYPPRGGGPIGAPVRPPRPRQWPYPPGPGIAPNPVQPPLPLDPFEYWPVPLPQPHEWPRHDPVICGPEGVGDPCRELANTKNRHCPGGKKSGTARKCKGQPRPSKSDCDRFKGDIPKWDKCCAARQDELRWRCLPPSEVPGHIEARDNDCKAGKHCKDIYDLFCRGQFPPYH